MKAKYLILLFGIMLTFSGCGAIKLAWITNKSTHPIHLRTDYPYYMQIKEDSAGNIFEEKVRMTNLDTIRIYQGGVQIDTIADDLMVTLQPMQDFHIACTLKSTWSKIEPYDLNISRLAIYSDSDTIVANSKEEIIKLFDDDRVKYIEELDKKNHQKHWRCIIIRK